MNQQLKELYETYYSELLEKKDLLMQLNKDVSSPLFMCVFDEYETANKKILIVGQETHSWCDYLGDYNPQELLDEYKIFELGQKVGFGKKPDILRILNSPFWNFSRRFFVNVNYLEQERTRGNRLQKGFLWTNISKIDVGGATPCDEVNLINKSGFELLRKEVQIIKPDIVLFMTGADYKDEMQNYLNLHFTDVFKTECEKTSIYQLNHSDKSFPKNTFKISHPRYLYGTRTHNIILDELLKIVEQKN